MSLSCNKVSFQPTSASVFRVTKPLRDLIRDKVRERGVTATYPLDWADDAYLCGLYVAALRVADPDRPVTFFFSRDELEEFLRGQVTGNYHPTSFQLEAFDIAATLDVAQRRNLIALTWPRPLEMPLDSPDELLARTPYALYRHIQMNLAALACRWILCSPPELDGVPIELGGALRTLGPGEGFAPAVIRQLLDEDGPVLALDEIIDIAQVLRLSYGSSGCPDGGIEIPASSAGRPTWHVDAAGLARDLLLARHLHDHRERLEQDVSTQRPEVIHRLRIAPFGDPPKVRSRYRSLFEYFDEKTSLRFVVSIAELDKAFAGGTKRACRTPQSTSGGGGATLVPARMGVNLGSARSDSAPRG